MKHISTVVLFIIIIVYISLTLVMGNIAEFNKGPDEETNLAYTEFIINYGRLPVTYEERDLVGKDSNWPALYHLLVAGISKLFGVEVDGPPHIKIFWDSFRYQALDGGGEWYYLRSEDQNWPYIGRILVLHIGRWLSTFFGVVTLLLVYGVMRDVQPQQPWLAVATVGLVAFLPSYTFISAVMNEDTMMSAALTLYVWLFILALKNPNKLWYFIALGFVLGLSVTIKYTPIILPLAVIITLVIFAHCKGYPWLWWVKRVLIVGVSAVVGSSWWFGWNFWYLNEIEERGWVTGLLRPIFTGGPDITLSRLGYYFSGGEIGLAGIPEGREAGSLAVWVQQTATTFWGATVNSSIAWSPTIYIFIALLVGVVLFGLWRLWQTETRSQVWLLLFVVHIAVFFILPLLRFSLTRRIGETAQGRHILVPAVVAVGILMIWGIVNAIPPRWHRLALASTIGIFLFWGIAHIERLQRFTPVPLPMRTVSQAAEWLSNPVEARFGEEILLVSYDLQIEPEAGVLHLELAWRSLVHTSENYLEKIIVLDSTGQPVSGWTGYHGGGQVPTLAWDPGDVIFDRLSLPLPSLLPGSYQVQVQLHGRAGPLPVSLPTESQHEVLTLPALTLAEKASITKPEQRAIVADDLVSPLDIHYALWQAAGPIPAEQTPTYRYPATIGVITVPQVQVSLVDEAGQMWAASQSVNGVHTFVIGPRWQSGSYHLRFDLVDSGGVNRQVTTGPRLTVENWWERDFDPPEIEQPLEANFADQIKLLGYKLSDSTVKAGEAFPVTLYWQAPPEHAPQANFTQFNNLLDGTGTVYGGYERNPLEYYNTLLWAPGEVVIDGYAVPVEANAPPGEYYLTVGYYLPVGESAVNLPLVIDGAMSDVSSVTIGPITVVGP